VAPSYCSGDGCDDEGVSLMAKPKTAARLDAARIEHAATLHQIEEATAARNSALLADDDKLAVKVATQIDNLRQLARGHGDKIKLLESELTREQAEAAAQRHEVHLREFEQTLAQADAAGDELQNAVAQLERSFRETIRLRELALSMWPFGKSSHGDAVARAPEGCALAAGAVSILLQHELHRIGTEPRLGGRPDERVKVPLPGGVPSRLTPLVDRKTGQLIPLKPLGEILRAASKFAVETLRGNKFIPPVVPQPPTPILVLGVEQPPPPPPPPAAMPRPPAAAGDIDGLQEYVPPAFRERLAALHAQQARLAAGDDDAAYEQCLRDLTALRNEIERARQGEAA
jgi:hypothetical protein